MIGMVRSVANRMMLDTSPSKQGSTGHGGVLS